jgi:hypothetical protein
VTTKWDVPIRSFCHRAPCLPTSLMGRWRPILHPHVMPARCSCCHEHRPHRTTVPEASPTTGSDARGTTSVLELGETRCYETDQTDEKPSVCP